jgi:hypothetical protein
MLTRDDERSDGGRTAYLRKPERRRAYDPELFDVLRDALIRKRERSIKIVSDRHLLPDAEYFSDLLNDVNRNAYWDAFDKARHNASLIFFDPDNGFEVESVPLGKRGSHKYLYWDEASAFFSRGYSLLVYQHFPRIERRKFLTLKVREIFARMHASTVYALTTSSVAFFLIPQKNDELACRGAVQRIGKQWQNEILPITFRNSR